MTDATHSWNRPWHALQRTLAAGITRCSAVAGSANFQTLYKPGRVPDATAPSGTWLRKVRSRMEATPVGAK
jgi:hypothetical protein